MVWFDSLLEDDWGSHHLMNGQQNWRIFLVRSLMVNIPVSNRELVDQFRPHSNVNK